MEISRNLSKQPFSTDSGRITLKNSLRDYVHLLKFADFRLLVLKCAGSYSQVFTVNGQQIKEKQGHNVPPAYMVPKDLIPEQG